MRESQLGPRSRKRGRRAKARTSEPRQGAVAVGAGPEQTSAAALGANKTSAAALGANQSGARAQGSDARGASVLSRSEQKNAAVRATLEPYAPGERPWSIRVAVVVAVLIGVGDLVDVLVGGKLGFGGANPAKGGVILFAVLLLVCAAGMWRMRYWAVLGFQAILAFVVLFFSLALIRASNIAGAVIAVVVICGGGFLFYKLVRVLSRIQMPRRARP